MYSRCWSQDIKEDIWDAICFISLSDSLSMYKQNKRFRQLFSQEIVLVSVALNLLLQGDSRDPKFSKKIFSMHGRIIRFGPHLSKNVITTYPHVHVIIICPVYDSDYFDLLLNYHEHGSRIKKSDIYFSLDISFRNFP